MARTPDQHNDSNLVSSGSTSSGPVSPDPDGNGEDAAYSIEQLPDTADHNDLFSASKKPIPGLYIVSTPIGHARDISLRALDTLYHADVVACEDTRVTGKLMSRYGLKTPLTPYHDHNAPRARPQLIERLNRGETVALVSDAGTPLISDPGYKLVCDCHDADIKVIAIPGASSIMTALVISGLPTDRFVFEGFLSSKTKARQDALQGLAPIAGTLVFLESAKRLAASLADMALVLGDRPAAVTRELTKMFEESRRGGLLDLAEHYKQAGPPKGEVTIVVGPPLIAEIDDQALDELLIDALKTSSLRDSVKLVTEASGLGHKKVYAHALALKNADGE